MAVALQNRVSTFEGWYKLLLGRLAAAARCRVQPLCLSPRTLALGYRGLSISSRVCCDFDALGKTRQNRRLSGSQQLDTRFRAAIRSSHCTIIGFETRGVA